MNVAYARYTYSLLTVVFSFLHDLHKFLILVKDVLGKIDVSLFIAKK